MNIKLNMNLILLGCGVIVWSGASGCVDRPAKETGVRSVTANWRERPEDKKVSTTRQAEKAWILGAFDPYSGARVVNNIGLPTTLDNQSVGRIPFAFVSQRNYHRALEKAGLDAELRILTRDGRTTFLNEQQRKEFRRRYPRPQISIEFGAMILLKGEFVTEELPPVIRGSKQGGDRKRRLERASELVRTRYFLADDNFELCEDVRAALSSDRKRFDVVFDGGCLPESIENVGFALECGVGKSAHTVRTTHELQAGRSTRMSLDLENDEDAGDLLEFSITNIIDLPQWDLFLYSKSRPLPRGIISVFQNPGLDDTDWSQ
ncbi:MAG: hypothetical protein O7F76_03215 [Planctomycetota bacterium]|nr:hypothetical protein [Planctomycetota bacterium]